MSNSNINYYIEVVYFNKKIGYVTYNDSSWEITTEFFDSEFFPDFSAAQQAVGFIGRFSNYLFNKGYGYKIKKVEVKHTLIKEYDENTPETKNI